MVKKISRNYQESVKKRRPGLLFPAGYPVLRQAFSRSAAFPEITHEGAPL